MPLSTEPARHLALRSCEPRVEEDVVPSSVGVSGGRGNGDLQQPGGIGIHYGCQSAHIDDTGEQTGRWGNKGVPKIRTVV